MLLPDHEIRRLCVPSLWQSYLATMAQREGITSGMNYLFDTKVPMIEPFSEAVSGNGVISYGVTSAGYDLRLGSEVSVFKNTSGEVMDPKRQREEGYREKMFDVFRDLAVGQRVLLPPNGYALGVAVERMDIPRWLKGRVVGKSTMARCGILINCTPIEPGWRGHLTIEISNISSCPAAIYIGEGIAQTEFELLSSIPEISYDDKRGKYQDQPRSPVPARVT